MNDKLSIDELDKLLAVLTKHGATEFMFDSLQVKLPLQPRQHQHQAPAPRPHVNIDDEIEKDQRYQNWLMSGSVPTADGV